MSSANALNQGMAEIFLFGTELCTPSKRVFWNQGEKKKMLEASLFFFSPTVSTLSNQTIRKGLVMYSFPHNNILDWSKGVNPLPDDKF